MIDEVKTSIDCGIGTITLTRASALHALNAPMCEAILSALVAWERDPAVHMVMIDHEDGTRGFCAGGDIRMLAESGAADGVDARHFFNVEYRMNVALAAFPKPVLAIMDGITMGGGVGLSVHGSHRVATERTTFAMPETGIGLFPDVGGGWFLPRLKGELGTWLALTGARLKGADVVAAQVATHFVPSELISNLKAQLRVAELSSDAAEMLATILDDLSQPVSAGSFEAHLATIDRCFAGDRAEGIMEALRAEDDPWAGAQAETLLTKSPETVKVALRQLREGAKMATFEDNMRMEYRIGWRKVQSHDFQEGVRAVIIDKDNAPVWAPAALEQVSDSAVAEYFASLGEDELSF